MSEEASDPQTSHERLLQLAMGDSLSPQRTPLIEALLRNPSITPEILWVLQKFAPGAFFHHPDTPRFLHKHEFMYATINSLLYLMEKERYSDFTIPIAIWETLAAHPSTELRAMLAACRALPEELFGVLAQDPDQRTRAVIAARRGSQELQERLAADESLWVRDGVARNPEATTETLVRIYETHPPKAHREETQAVYASLAKHAATPAWILEVLAKHDGYQVANTVAQNPNTPPETLERLAQHPDKTVRRDLAKNPKLPLPLLTLLARDPDFDIRCSVACNKNATAEVLIYVTEHGSGGSSSSDSYGGTYRYVAANRNTPAELFHRLARFDDLDILLALVENPSAPVELLQRLARELPWRVERRREARARISTAIASNPGAPPELLAELYHKSAGLVHSALCQNPRTPPEILEALYQSAKHQIELARNPSALVEWLTKFSQARSFQLRAMVAQNPSLPVEVLEVLCRDESDPVRREAHEAKERAARRQHP